MKITAQLSGVNRPLSVELRLMTFVPAIFDSQEENHTAPGQLLLTKRSDFRSAEELVRCSPFGGVEIGKKPGRSGLNRSKQRKRRKKSLFPQFAPVKIMRFPAPATNPPDDRNRSAGKCCGSFRTDDAKRSSLQNRVGYWAITRFSFDPASSVCAMLGPSLISKRGGLINKMGAILFRKWTLANQRSNAGSRDLCDSHSVQHTCPKMPDSCHRREIICRNCSGEGFGINKGIYLHCLLVRRVAVIACTNRVTGQDHRNLWLGFQYLKLGLHAGMSLTAALTRAAP